MTIGVCDDLRLGGTLASTGITGGLSINSSAIQIFDWSGVYGYVGLSGSVVEINGRPGGYLAGDLLGLTRFLDLPIRFTRFGPSQTLVEDTDCEQLVANTDDFLALLRVPNQLLELDMPDGTTRFLVVTALTPASIAQPRTTREAIFGATAPWPYWRQGGQEDSTTVNGAGVSVPTLGTAPIYDAKFVFAGNGTISHDTEGWQLEVVGASGPVTVDLAPPITITEGGLPATNRLRRTRRNFAWLTPGANSLTSTVSVEVVRRNQYE